MSENEGKAHFLNACTLTLSSDSKLHVHGSVMTYCADDEVSISKTDANEDSAKLVLGLAITHGTTPMEAAPRPFNYIEHGDHVSGYKQVVIRYQDEECAIDMI